MIGYLFLGFAGSVAGIELASRIYHRIHFGIPFHSKVIGEYPYSSFLEKTDPPLYWVLKKNFHHPLININRFRCRGPEPAPDGEKKRLLLIGESTFFGVKLLKEKYLWSIRLQKILEREGRHEWEIINAGNPTYNSFQHRILWERELRNIRPDILLIEIGGNDITQAWMMGSKWKPGTPWPWEFVMALERKSPWWNKILGRFCAYYLIRRSATERKGFPRLDEEYKLKECVSSIEENFKIIVEDAIKMGTKVAIINLPYAIDPDIDDKDARALDTIQSNWRKIWEERGKYDIFMITLFSEILPKRLNLPLIDVYSPIHGHQNRYELFLDIFHLNKKGMKVIADVIYRDIDRIGWWNR